MQQKDDHRIDTREALEALYDKPFGASLVKEIDRKLASIEDERSVLLYIRHLAMKEVSRAIGGGSNGGWDEKGVRGLGL